MSTATFTPAARRFAWKEYRMLRALWLSVAALAIVELLFSRLVVIDRVTLPQLLFASALFAAVLYAVGAASIVFSIEHDEETYNFLAGLPITSPPLFIGKLLVVTLSSLALAAAILLAGWAIGGSQWPSSDVAHGLLAACGVGIFEAIAWGTFFSILVKRPLVAALLALLVGTISVQWIVTATSNRQLAAGNILAYEDALPRRLAVVAALMCVNAMLAARWLRTSTSRRPSASDSIRQNLLTSAAGLTAEALTTPANSVSDAFNRAFPGIASAVSRQERRARLFRLVWQTWRQSRRMLLLPVGATSVIVAAAVRLDSLAPLFHRGGFSLILFTPIILPTLCGALAFGADQRRRQYRFLAEHAAPPRDVWFARHILWLGGILLAMFIVILALALFAIPMLPSMAGSLFANRPSSIPNNPPAAIVYAVYFSLFGRGLMLMLGVFAAYAFGQLCSMLIRSEIMAVFSATILNILLTAWIAAIIAWHLDSRLFLLPLAVGAMAATFLRAPDWLAERNTWSAWWRPAAATIAPLVLAVVCLPIARLAQLRAIKGIEPTPELAKSFAHMTPAQRDQIERIIDPLSARAPFAAGDTSDARQTGDMYLHAVEAYENPTDDASQAAALKEFLAATERPTCRFHFDGGTISQQWLRYSQVEPSDIQTHDDPGYHRVANLISKLTRSGGIPGATGIDRYLPLLRACQHLGSGQPTVINIRAANRERSVLEAINRWVNHGTHTDDELRDAQTKLADFFAKPSDPGECLVADADVIHAVVLGRQPAVILTPPVQFTAYLTFIANELPWERTRALRAIDVITQENLHDAEQLSAYLNRAAAINDVHLTLQRWIGDSWSQQNPQFEDASNRWLFTPAATSYLVRDEYLARVPLQAFYHQLCDIETCRRATQLTIALALYHHAHDYFPDTLATLVPMYIEPEPLDPYSGRSFIYVPQGLDLELAGNGFDNVSPGTPFFYSIGIRKASVVRHDSTYSESDDNNPNTEPIVRQVANYYLLDEGQNWSDDPLVFPLAK
jgi:ABC-type transport system involved in multi-copper enzyme maturation permease subunit